MKYRRILALLAVVLTAPLLAFPQAQIMPGSGGGTASTFNIDTLASATFCSDTGSSDAYACNFSPAPASLAAMKGAVVTFKAGTVNTGAATFAPNGFAATPIVKVGQTVTTALVTNDIRDESYVTVVYDEANNVFVCLTCDGNRAGLTTSSSWTAAQVASNSYWTTGTAGTSGFEFSPNGNTGSGNAKLITATANTPDAPYIATGTTSNAIKLGEFADVGFDSNLGACGTAACTDPSLVIVSAVQDTTQYNTLAAWGQAGGAIKTLTESAATSLVQIPVASGAGTGGSVRYTVFASDATDHQIREGEIKFAVVNKAGTETCTISAASEAADGSVIAASLGTLTYAITCSTTPSNAVDIQLNAVSSLTQTTLQATYSVKLVGPGQPARQ